MEWKKNLKSQKTKKGQKFYLVQMMENQKELEKILKECLENISMLKKKILYLSTKCKKIETTEDITLSTKTKDLLHQIECLQN